MVQNFIRNGALLFLGHWGSFWLIIGRYWSLGHFGSLWLIMGHFGSFCILVQPSLLYFSANQMPVSEFQYTTNVGFTSLLKLGKK